MTTIEFTKGHGTGNDFVIVPDPDGALDLDDHQVAALCDRRFGIGADGTLRVVRSAALPEGARTPDAEWFMDYRNADGSAAEMCGNGIRVFAAYLVQSGLATIDDAPLRIGTRAGTKTLTRSDLGFEVDLGLFAVEDGDVVVRARRLEVPRPGLGIDVGNPHVVVALGSDAELDALDLTVQPQLAPVPAHGANIEFVVPADPLVHGGVGSIRMRVFERGVGDPLVRNRRRGIRARRPTLGRGRSARSVEREGSRRDLGVRVVDESDGAHVLLSGPAALVYTGRITLA